MIKHLRSAFVVFGALTLLTGVLYPLVVTIIAQGVFSAQANGSLIHVNGKAVGSELIGQHFTDQRYFWGRPSATSPPYDSSFSTGSNLGPTNPELIKLVKERIDIMRKSHPDQAGAVPADLVTTSGSGLDPHISPAAAEFQASRVAKVRGLSIDDIRRLIASYTEGQTFGVLGEPRVNVLLLNLALDQISKQ